MRHWDHDWTGPNNRPLHLHTENDGAWVIRERIRIGPMNSEARQIAEGVGIDSLRAALKELSPSRRLANVLASW